MTRVEFFFNVPDKLEKSVELCGKAIAKGRQVTVFTENDDISNQLQQQLWQASETSFLPSAMPSDGTCRYAPISLDSLGDKLHQDDILINLRAEHPPFFSRFRVLVELVGSEEADKVAARLRFRFYRERGYEIKSTDINSR